MEPVKVAHIQHGPFQGRAYEVKDDGSMGRRRRDLEPRPRHATKHDVRALQARVAAIPDQATLDEILNREPNAIHRAAILNQWRPWLSFEPKTDDPAEISA